MELIEICYQDEDVLVCVKPPRVLSTDEPGGLPELLRVQLSDPGADLVALCAAEQIPVTAVPGACAAVLALILSGLPTDRFVFEGFLPVGGKERRQRLAAIAAEPRTVLLHEAPHRLLTTLCDLCAVAGETRRVTLCRELTKQNEEIRRVTLGAARDYYEENAPRGEFVLVLEGAAEKSADPAENPAEASVFYQCIQWLFFFIRYPKCFHSSSPPYSRTSNSPAKSWPQVS